MNTFGTNFRLTTFGASHDAIIGGVIDGCPVGLSVDVDYVAAEMQRRHPGASTLTSARQEPDGVEWISGLADGLTTGEPLVFIIRNTDVRSTDYDELRHLFRPGHADYTYFLKYGCVPIGGGRASARETAVRVAAGAIAKLLLNKSQVHIAAYLSQVGAVTDSRSYTFEEIAAATHHLFPTPDMATAKAMQSEIRAARTEGDSVGGVVSCVVAGLPAGVGNPIFNKLQARLAGAMLSIPAAKGFDYGSGFAAAAMHGSQNNDAFMLENGHVVTATNHAGGILGGISTGAEVRFRVAFKPTPSIKREQRTVTDTLQPVTLSVCGRHDACVAVRAVPVVEAMAALVLADFIV